MFYTTSMKLQICLGFLQVAISTLQSLLSQSVHSQFALCYLVCRQLHAHSPGGSTATAAGSGKGLDGLDLDDAFCGDAIDDLLVVQGLLQKAYRLFPRVVLSCCLQSFKGNDKVLYQASLIFFQDHLLYERSLSASAPATSAAAASVSAGGPGPAPLDADFKCPCLAAEVLAQLPDTQQWLRRAIFSISQGET